MGNSGLTARLPNPTVIASAADSAPRLQVSLVIGPPRSGTTMLGFLLAGGRRVMSLSEPHLVHAIFPDWHLQRFFRNHQRAGGLKRRRPPFRGDSEAFGRFLRQSAMENRFRRLVIKETYRRGGLPRDWCNEPLLDHLVESNGSVVALIRHPYDLAASWIKLCRWAIGPIGWLVKLCVWNMPAFSTPTHVVRCAAENWAAYITWTKRHGLTLLRYEDFVEYPESQLRAVCDRLGIEFEPNMLDYAHPRADFGGFGDPGVMKTPRPVDKSAIGRGDNLTDEQRGIVRDFCAAGASNLDYTL